MPNLEAVARLAAFLHALTGQSWEDHKHVYRDPTEVPACITVLACRVLTDVQPGVTDATKAEVRKRFTEAGLPLPDCTDPANLR